MESEPNQLRQLAASLRKEAAELEERKTTKIAALFQAGQALVILKEKLHHVL